MIKWVDYRNTEHYYGKTRWYLDTAAGNWIIEEKEKGVFHAVLLDHYEEELDNLGPFDCEIEARVHATYAAIIELNRVINEGRRAEKEKKELSQMFIDLTKN